MSEQVVFDLKQHARGVGLSVSAPFEVVHEAQSRTPRQVGGLNVRLGKIFETQAEGDRQTWVLNDFKIGRQNEERRHHKKYVEAAALKAGHFIGELVKLGYQARPAQLEVGIKSFEPEPNGFNFQAEIKNPTTSSERVKESVKQYAAPIAFNLGLFHLNDLAEYEHQIASGTKADARGISISMGDGSRLQTDITEWDPDSARCLLRGKNIRAGRHSLVYLVAAVAVTKAEQLVPA